MGVIGLGPAGDTETDPSPGPPPAAADRFPAGCGPASPDATRCQPPRSSSPVELWSPRSGPPSPTTRSPALTTELGSASLSGTVDVRSGRPPTNPAPSS